MKIASTLPKAALSAAIAAAAVGATITALAIKKIVVHGDMRRAGAVRQTGPQRDRFIIQPRNKLKEDNNQHTNARRDPSEAAPAFSIGSGNLRRRLSNEVVKPGASRLLAVLRRRRNQGARFSLWYVRSAGAGRPPRRPARNRI